MSEQRKARLSEGDWVAGTTMNDERIRGYVRSCDALTGIAAVFVVESDRTESVGKTAYAKEAQLKRLPDDEALHHPEALRELIDVALAARDEVWFYELTAELVALTSTLQGMTATPA
ncbi:MAG TPA: IDEAL domain-containing protein [Paenibacillus sp.]|nr:IDEAL domain-containing protein [Paenibacillus sp.]